MPYRKTAAIEQHLFVVETHIHTRARIIEVYLTERVALHVFETAIVPTLLSVVSASFWNSESR